MVKTKSKNNQQRKCYKTLDVMTKARIIQASKDGMSQNNIVKEFESSKGQVNRLLSKYRRKKSIDRKQGSGRIKKTTPRDDRNIMRLVKKDPFISASVIKKDLGLNVSIDTIERRIKSTKEFQSYRAAKKPFLTKQQMKRRYQWACLHRTWTNEQWMRILWTDESQFVPRFNRQ